MVPPAPTAFSTVTVWPSDFDIGTAIMRATTSVGPPAANGTTSAIGWSGQGAWAAAASEKAASDVASRVLGMRIVVSFSVGWVSAGPPYRDNACGRLRTYLDIRADRGLIPRQQRAHAVRLRDGPQPIQHAAHLGPGGGTAVL